MTLFGHAAASAIPSPVSLIRRILAILTLAGTVAGWTVPAFANAGSWNTVPPLPTAREAPTAASINGKLYVVGGQNQVASLNVLEVFDPATNSWTTKASMPTPRSGAFSGAIDGKLYVAGGIDNFSGTVFNIVEVYDPLTDTWTIKTSMPMAQGGGASAALNGKLYAVGGIAAFVFNNPRNGVLQVYDPLADTWSTKAPMPTARSAAAAVIANGKLDVLGGEPTNTSFTAANEVYDPDTDTWTSKAPMPTPRGGLVAGVINGLVYAISGYAGSVTYSVNEVYNPTNDGWTADAPILTARIAMGSGVINGAMYVVGGETATIAALTTAEVFTVVNAPSYSSNIQPPVNADGSSVFNIKRGVVPVKFRLAIGGAPTCELPSATISLIRTAGGTLGAINETEFLQPSDIGANFRIDAANCQYIYNLGASSLGLGTYLVQINIGNAVVGSGTFSLK
jgi:N-acetylneuraminic acid mutarotase